MDRVFLKEKEEKRIRLGHPWIFDNEIGNFQGPCADGTPVEVMSKSGLFLGRGIINRKSRITVRIFTRNRDELIDRSFFERRIANACSLREAVFSPEESYRLIFAEADLLPGLVCDRFVSTDGDVYLSVQFLTLGVETFRDDIISVLRNSTGAKGIYERSDVHVRNLEGISERKGWIGPEANPQIVIRENGVELAVDLENGQKTGYFLDQKNNRSRILPLVKGRRVLDAFTHTGSFALNAWKGGADSVLAVDISETAVDTVNKNILLNGAGTAVTAQTADVFDLLKAADRDGERYGCIILDPPAFTKSAKMAQKAYGGYKEINLRAMKILESGGYLVSCSCSHFFSADQFYHMIQNAAMDAGKTIQFLGKYGPSADHPVLAGYPESDYLKCAVMRVW